MRVGEGDKKKRVERDKDGGVTKEGRMMEWMREEDVQGRVE